MSSKASARNQNRNKKKTSSKSAVPGKNVMLIIAIAAVIVAILVLVLVFVPGKEDDIYEPFSGPTSGQYTATIEVQDYGTIELLLDHDTAPITVENFVKLAQSGFYDGLTFHRIMSGFMIQGGDPEGNGTGGSDETIKGEFSANGVTNLISHERGVISMARNSRSMDSASSQFFIMHADNPSLDGNYAAFGRVTEGMEVVDAIAEAARPVDDNGTIPAEEQPVITKITVTAP